MEEWKIIATFPEYEVSTIGNIRRAVDSCRSYKKGRPVSSHNCFGYRRVSLCINGVETKTTIHRLVALAFLPPAPIDKPFVNHRNGDRSDNRIENLEWCSHYENHMHSIEVLGNQYGERHGSAKLSKEQVIAIHHLRMEKVGPTKIAEKFGVSKPQIAAILSRRLRWRDLIGYPKDYPPLRLKR